MAIAKRKRRGEDALAAALGSGHAMKEAAKLAGISLRTARRISTDPAFKARVRELRGQAIEQSAGLLADSGAEAVTVLRALLRSESDTARLNAARTILDNLLRWREQLDLAERLEALENQFAQETVRRREPC